MKQEEALRACQFGVIGFFFFAALVVFGETVRINRVGGLKCRYTQSGGKRERESES